MDSKEKMLSIKEAAGVLGVGRDSVGRLIKRGGLRGVRYPRMGGCGKNVTIRIPESELERFQRDNPT